MGEIVNCASLSMLQNVNGIAAVGHDLRFFVFVEVFFLLGNKPLAIVYSS